MADDTEMRGILSMIRLKKEWNRSEIAKATWKIGSKLSILTTAASTKNESNSEHAEGVYCVS